MFGLNWVLDLIIQNTLDKQYQVQMSGALWQLSESEAVKAKRKVSRYTVNKPSPGDTQVLLQ